MITLTNPVYVVSGFMRSGTSMMMKALEAGGMQACYRQSRDEMKNQFADEHYDPNVNGLYELEREDYLKPDFPKGYEGTLIKALRMGPARMLPSIPIKVLFMRRDAEEIRQSCMAFFGKIGLTVKAIEAQVSKSLEAALSRPNTELMEIPYRQVVENPTYWFTVIRDFGFPIDVAKAASIVDSQYCRYKLENLEVGIV